MPSWRPSPPPLRCGRFGAGRRLRPVTAREAPWPIWFGPLVVGAIGLGFGLIPDWVSRWLVEPAVRAFHFTREDITLKLFYGFNYPLLLSVITMTLGGVFYLARRRLRRTLVRLLTAVPVTMENVYEGGVKATLAIAKWQTQRLQNGSLFQYLIVIIGATVIGVGGALLHSGAMRFVWSGPSLPVWLGLLLVCMLIGIGIVVRTRSRLLAICGLGVIGTGMAVIFLAYGAPDVGLTQLLVETLTLIIAAIVLSAAAAHRKNIIAPVSHVWSSACWWPSGSGALVTALMLAVNHHEVDRTITAFYEQASYVKAHGRNIVNVILVDFRSLDTLGEIIVVAASALAALALIRGKRSPS